MKLSRFTCLIACSWTTACGNEITLISDGGSRGQASGSASVNVTSGAATSSPLSSTSATVSSGNTSSSSSGGGTCEKPESTQDCASCHDLDKCFSGDIYTPGCCELAALDGPLWFQNAVIDGCGCDVGAPCFSVCSGDASCTDPWAGTNQACADCFGTVSDTDSCYQNVESHCAANAICNSWRVCQLACYTW